MRKKMGRLIPLPMFARDVLRVHECTVRRKMNRSDDPGFPRPVRIGPRIYFDEAEVARWLELKKRRKPRAITAPEVTPALQE